jgi:hypothetical protein
MSNTEIIQSLAQIGRCIVIATHPRSGTHLTIDLLRKQFRECKSWLWFGETLHHSYLNLDMLALTHSLHISQQEALLLLSRARRPIIKTHSLPSFEQFDLENTELIRRLIQNADIYYVVRDGRDVLCSVHLWRQQVDPKARCPLSEFLRQEENGMSRPRIWAAHVLSWLNKQGVRILRFEQIIKDTRKVLTQIGQELGLKPLYVEPLLPKRRQSDSRWADYWLRLTRQFESTAIVGRYLGQKPQKWQDAFTCEDREFFQQEAGDVLIRLGYEVSEAWVEAESLRKYL